MNSQKGITLIGMPGAGKSTIGKQLAELLGWKFVDLDVLINKGESQSPAEIIRERGEREFIELEEKYVLALDLAEIVFSPGGSIIYSPKAMAKLQSETNIVYLDLPLEEIRKRLGRNLEPRGIIGLALSGLDNLYRERILLYQKFAHHTVSCAGLNEKEIIDKIYKLL